MKQHVVPVCYTPLAVVELEKFKRNVQKAVEDSKSELAAAKQELSELTSQRSEGYLASLPKTLTRNIYSYLPVFAEAEARVAAAKSKVERSAELAQLALQLPSFENHPDVVLQAFKENYSKPGVAQEGDVVTYVYACKKMRDSQEMSATSWAHAVNSFLKPSDDVSPIDCSKLLDTGAIDAHYREYKRALGQAITAIDTRGPLLPMSKFSELAEGKKTVYEAKERDILFSSISVNYEKHLQGICAGVKAALGGEFADFSGDFESAIKDYVASPTVNAGAHRLSYDKLNELFPSDLDVSEARAAATRLKDFVNAYNLANEDKIYEQLVVDNKSTMSDKTQEIIAQSDLISTSQAQLELQAAKLKRQGIDTRITMANKESSKEEKDNAQSCFDSVNQEYEGAKQSLRDSKDRLAELKKEQSDFNKKLRSDAEREAFEKGASYSPLTKGLTKTLDLVADAQDPAGYLKHSLIRFCHSSSFIHDELKETQEDRRKRDLEFTGINPIKNKSQVVFYRPPSSKEVDAKKVAETFAAAQSGAAEQENSLHFHVAITRDQVAVHCSNGVGHMVFDTPKEIAVFKEAENFFKSRSATQRKLCFKDKQLIKSETMFNINALINIRLAEMREVSEHAVDSTSTNTPEGSDTDTASTSSRGSDSSSSSRRSRRSRQSERSDHKMQAMVDKMQAEMQAEFNEKIKSIEVQMAEQMAEKMKALERALNRRVEGELAVKRELIQLHAKHELALRGSSPSVDSVEVSPSPPPADVPPVAGNSIPLSGCPIATLVGGVNNMRCNSAPPAPIQRSQVRT